MTSTPTAGLARSPEDFPPMWQKPAFSDLMECLLSLRLELPIWNSKQKKGRRASFVSTVFPNEGLGGLEVSATSAASVRQEITRYLSTVISSPLDWLDDDDQRDMVWTEAGRRLSERCGRAAMGEVTRRWPFECDEYPAFELAIREPPLTGDSLGHKTWGSSYALARMLYQFGEGPLGHLIAAKTANAAGHNPVRVLELGSGTGLLGLAAAAIWKAPVVLSDLPEIVPNLAHNVDQNREVVEALGGQVTAGALTWGGLGDDEVDSALFGNKNQFKIVLAADPLYDDNHPTLLAEAIDDHMAHDPEARALVMVPLRDATTVGLLSSFRCFMSSKDLAAPFVCLEEGTVHSEDDWGEGQEVGQDVQSWWGIFQRRQEAGSAPL